MKDIIVIGLLLITGTVIAQDRRTHSYNADSVTTKSLEEELQTLPPLSTYIPPGTNYKVAKELPLTDSIKPAEEVVDTLVSNQKN